MFVRLTRLYYKTDNKCNVTEHKESVLVNTDNILHIGTEKESIGNDTFTQITFVNGHTMPINGDLNRIAEIVK